MIVVAYQIEDAQACHSFEEELRRRGFHEIWKGLWKTERFSLSRVLTGLEHWCDFHQFANRSQIRVMHVSGEYPMDRVFMEHFNVHGEDA